jgi:hypothetical protein
MRCLMFLSEFRLQTCIGRPRSHRLYIGSRITTFAVLSIPRVLYPGLYVIGGRRNERTRRVEEMAAASTVRNIMGRAYEGPRWPLLSVFIKPRQEIFNIFPTKLSPSLSRCLSTGPPLASLALLQHPTGYYKITSPEHRFSSASSRFDMVDAA